VLPRADEIQLLYDRVTDFLDLETMKRLGLLLDYFPLHTRKRLLRPDFQAWGGIWNVWRWDQPIDEIQAYFGTAIALYFDFVAYLVKAMIIFILGTLGITCWVWAEHGLYNAIRQYLLGSAYHSARIALAMWTIVWTEVFIVTLKAHVARRMNQWGCDSPDFSTVKAQENPRFHGKLQPSEVDGNLLEVSGQAAGRRRASLLTALFVSFVVCCVAGLYAFFAHLDRQGFDWAYGMASCVVSGQIKLFKQIWKTYSQKLVDLENHQDLEGYTDSRGFKVIVFQFINAFASFGYVAFAMPWLDHCPPEGCWGYLCHQMVIVFATFLAFALCDIVEPVAVITYRTWWREQRASSRQGHELQKLSYFERQGKMLTYTCDSLIEDWCQIIMPLAYVVMFGITMPGCGVLALLCFGLQMRVDAFKLTRFMRRPYPSKLMTKTRGGLGVWMRVLEVLCVFTTLSNIGLVVFSLDPFASWSVKHQLILFGALGLGTNGLKVLLGCLCPEVGGDVLLARERHAYQRRKLQHVLVQNAAVARESKSFKEYFGFESPTRPSRSLRKLLEAPEKVAHPVLFRASSKTSFSGSPV